MRCLSDSSLFIMSEKQHIIDRYLSEYQGGIFMVALPLAATRWRLKLAVSFWVVEPRNREVTGSNLIKCTGMSWTEASITRTELTGESSWWLWSWLKSTLSSQRLLQEQYSWLVVLRQLHTGLSNCVWIRECPAMRQETCTRDLVGEAYHARG